MNVWEMRKFFKCQHLQSKCVLLTPCCDNVYHCRHCHDEKEEHVLDIKTVTTIICVTCALPQPLKEKCLECNINFGKYACLECRYFNDFDMKQFHCDECGVCRVGGQENYYHCPKCNLCLSLRLIDHHKCIENAGDGDCPVCIESLKCSTKLLHIPMCGHLIHETCYKDLISKSTKMCPVCMRPY